MAGNELLSFGRAGERRRCVQCLVQDSCPLLVTGSGGESTFFRAAFALLTVKFTVSLFIIIPPRLVALNFWRVKLFSGRKTCISTAAPLCGTGLMAPGIVCALRGPGQAQALSPQLAASPLLLGAFIFFPQLEII